MLPVERAAAEISPAEPREEPGGGGTNGPGEPHETGGRVPLHGAARSG